MWSILTDSMVIPTKNKLSFNKQWPFIGFFANKKKIDKTSIKIDTIEFTVDVWKIKRQKKEKN